MLTPMGLVDQWRAIEQSLPEGWVDARLRLIVLDRSRAGRAAALLGPANPGLRGSFVSFHATRRGSGPSSQLVRRLLARLDTEKIGGTLDLRGVDEAPATATASAPARAGLTAQWDGLVAGLPDDWSDVYGEIELGSSDYLERGALLLAPLNPARFGEDSTFRFRAARRFGYGASAQMTRRCFERLDAEGITGRVQVLRALSDTKPVYTQGPVWYVGGKPV
jgi:hypothetical protein